jgi:hypothetical protein
MALYVADPFFCKMEYNENTCWMKSINERTLSGNYGTQNIRNTASSSQVEILLGKIYPDFLKAFDVEHL